MYKLSRGKVFTFSGSMSRMIYIPNTLPYSQYRNKFKLSIFFKVIIKHLIIILTSYLITYKELDSKLHFPF